jgi:hypothetical protein
MYPPCPGVYFGAWGRPYSNAHGGTLGVLHLRGSSSTLSCERASSRRGTRQESRRTSGAHVPHDLARRLSAPHHAALLIPTRGASAIRYAIQLCLHVFHRNMRAFRLNPNLPVTLFRQLYRETRRFLRVIVSPTNPVTGCISMKTIIKLRMPFFSSCIMVLGALASPECAACSHTPQDSHILLRRTLAPAARLYLAVCRASDL